MQQEQQQGDPFYIRDSFSGLYFFARCAECVWTIPCRKDHGVHYPGIPGLVCAVIIMFVAAFSQEPEIIFAFMVVWLTFLMIRRARSLSMARQGIEQHSLYAGYPVFMMRVLPGLKTEIKARNMEPLVFMGIGWVVMQFVPHLGGLLMVGAVGNGVTRMIEAQGNFIDVVRMRDIAILQRQKAARYRGETNEY